jgi:hypothetical protein
MEYKRGFPELEEGEVDLEELPGPPCRMATEGIEYTHKVYGIQGHPYYLFARPQYNAAGDIISILWHNPDSQRSNKLTFG